jgi:HAD superfamily hydrolase (TIGR01490 family)
VKRFAAFDIDGTLIRWQLYHALTDEMAKLGYISQANYAKMKHARMEWKKRAGTSFKDYERHVIQNYNSVIKSLDFKQLDTAIDAVFKEYRDQIYTYTRDLIAKLKDEDYLLFAISGSQVEIVSKISKYYGFDDYVGSIYERTATGFSGQRTTGAFDKDKSLKALVDKYSAGYQDSLAVGDGFSDVAMLELVEKPIAFNPELTLFEHAKTKGWKIVIERKNVVFELESQDGHYRLV